MDGDDQMASLEARLKRLRPAPVPPELMARLRAARPPAAQPRREWRLWPAWAAAAAAAAVLALAGALLWQRPEQQGPARVAAAAPSGTPRADLEVRAPQGYIVGARREGVWHAPDGRAYRVVRCLGLNKTVLRHPEQGARADVFEPRERILLLAMKSQ